MSFLITTTGLQDPVVFYDLGERTFPHPTTSYDLELEFTKEEIRDSQDIADALDNGWITIVSNGVPILNGGDIINIIGDDQTAVQVPYDNTASGLAAVEVQAAIDEVEARLDTVEGSGGGLGKKAGSITGASFTGNPKTSTVVFTTAHTDANYSPTVISDIDSRGWTVENLTVNGFDINANSSQTLAGTVYWSILAHGEA